MAYRPVALGLGVEAQFRPRRLLFAGPLGHLRQRCW